MVKHIADRSKLLGTSLGWKLTSVIPGLVRKDMSVVVVSSVPCFEKQWAFINSVAATNMVNQYERIFKILDKFPADVLCLRQHVPVHIRAGKLNVAMGIFTPYGSACVNVGGEQLIKLVLHIAEFIQLLHQHSIVHNDIRWANIMCHEGSYFLVDYDDAFLINSEHPLSPGLDFNTVEHPPSIKSPHGFEVDIWALGHLLLSGSHMYNLSITSLGNEIKERYKSMTIEEIVDKLKAI